MADDQQENEMLDDDDRKFLKVIARAWADDGFKQRLLSDPGATLKAEGLDVPSGPELRAVENTDEVQYMVLPAKPEGLVDEELDVVGFDASLTHLKSLGPEMRPGCLGMTMGGKCWTQSHQVCHECR